MNRAINCESFQKKLHGLGNTQVPHPELELFLKDISAYPSFGLPAEGERSRHVIHQTPQFEVVLMLWGPNSASPIHGHGGSQCSMALLSGDLVETRYRPFVATAVSERALPLGHVTRIHDEVSFHKLSSVSGATSLHLYSTPLLSMQTFDEQQSQWVSKTVSELN